MTNGEPILSPSKPSPSSLPYSASLPATPLFNKYVFEPAYYLPDRLSYPGLSFDTLNSPELAMDSKSPTNSDRWKRSTLSEIQPTRHSSHSDLNMSDADSSALLDVSLMTDTSSTLDDSLPVGPFLPSTPTAQHIRIHTETPPSADGLLMGLGLGLILKDGKPFDGMGLLSEQFAKFGRGDSDEDEDDNSQDSDTGPSQKFLHETFLTFSQEGYRDSSTRTDMLPASSPVDTVAFADLRLQLPTQEYSGFC